MRSLLKQTALVVLPHVAYGYVRFLRATMRIEYRNREVLDRVRRESGRYILAFWHSRFLLMPFCYPDRRLVLLASRHRDAEFLVRMLRHFGLEFARGSTSAGAVAGLREVVRKARSGFDVGIAPDGPRGPRRRVQAGVVAIARMTGFPVVPVTFSAHPARRLRSWDRTLVPRPFSRGLFAYGEPIRVPREADGSAGEAYRVQLEEILGRLTDEADRETGVGPEAPPSEGSAT